MLLNRRRHSRKTVYADVYVDLVPNNGGWLSNISEGGLELQPFFPVESGQAVRLEFPLPGTLNGIEVNCQIAWTDRFGRKAGLRFLDLSEVSHRRIREWRPLSVTMDRGAMPKPASRRIRISVILVLLVISLVILYPFVQEWLPASRRSAPPTETAASRKVKVWTVKRTGLYYCPESKLYCKAESGVLMTQEKALEGGYRPTGGATCR